MNTVVNLTQEEIQALDICAQLIEIGEFKLAGSSLIQVAQAKLTLTELLKKAKAPVMTEETSK